MCIKQEDYKREELPFLDFVIVCMIKKEELPFLYFVVVCMIKTEELPFLDFVIVCMIKKEELPFLDFVILCMIKKEELPFLNLSFREWKLDQVFMIKDLLEILSYFMVALDCPFTYYSLSGNSLIIKANGELYAE